MPKLPTLSSEKTIKCFEKLGYEIVRQKGSHIRLHHKFDRSKKPLTIPEHKIIGRGLLRKLIRDADISVDEFIEILNEL